MKYSFSVDDQITTLEVDHLLYQYENNQLLEEIVERIEDECVEFIIDLSQLTYMNSVGLSFLIATLTKARTVGGEVVLVNTLDSIKKMLAITKLQSIFNVFPTVEEAKQYLLQQAELIEK